MVVSSLAETRSRSEVRLFSSLPALLLAWVGLEVTMAESRPVFGPTGSCSHSNSHWISC